MQCHVGQKLLLTHGPVAQERAMADILPIETVTQLTETRLMYTAGLRNSSLPLSVVTTCKQKRKQGEHASSEKFPSRKKSTRG